MIEPTEVTITIDTEFSIAGAFDENQNYKPVSEKAVLCDVEGREHGLGFLLDNFDKYNISASFFIECANYYYFGDDPMAPIVKRIQKAGQDVQLHVHPVWLSFITDPEIGIFPQQDSCADLTFDDLKTQFELCIKIFENWTSKRPEAIRTGSLVADRNIYQVMSSLNIPMASNVALGVFQPKEKNLQLYGGRYSIENVLEMPVFSYQDLNIMGRKHIKSLQITSCSWPEMKYILTKARQQGIRNIVILTHPFEFIKKSDFQYSKLIRNRVNQNRLIKLCQFLAEHDQDFKTVSFAGGMKNWLNKDNNLEQKEKFKIPSHYAIIRKIHNKINDALWYY